MKKLVDIVEKVQTKLGIFFLSLYLFCALLQIIGRYFHWSVPWTEEISNYSFIWAAFMGSSIMLRQEGGHFSLTALKDKLIATNRSTKLLDIIIYTLLLLFSILVFFYGIQLVMQFKNWRLSSLPNVKQWIIWLCMPIAGASTCLYSLEGLVNAIRK